MATLKMTTATAESAATAAMKELKAESTEHVVRETLKAMETQLREAAANFNAMRAEFAAYATLLKGTDADMKKFAAALEGVRFGDYGRLLREERVFEHIEVEDAGLFAETERSVLARKSFNTRIEACIEVNDRIAAAMAGWQSKIDKMGAVSLESGSSQSEASSSAVKTVKFGKAIRTLKERGGRISDIYYSTVREIEEYLKSAKKRFKPIFPMESTGKESAK